MNPVFWILVMLGAAMLWLTLRRLFIWIGKKVWSVAEDTMNIMTYKEPDNSNKGEENNE